MIVTDLVTTVSLVIAVNASPRAERRAFRVTAWLWQRRFARGFFRLAGLGRIRVESRKRGSVEQESTYRLVDLAPAPVKSRFPELPELLRRLEKVQVEMRVREAEVARALAESGGERTASARTGELLTSSTDGAPTEHALQGRRATLVAELRDALETTRVRRATISAALENVRIQLLRIGAGVGTPEDMRAEVAALQALVDG
jgi:hypothetical protein